MAITSTTSWAPATPTEVLDGLILSYLRSAMIVQNMVRSVDLTSIPGLKYDFNSFGSLAAASTTQGTDLTPAALTVVEDGTVTAAEVGVAVEFTRIAELATGGQITDDDVAREIANALATNLQTTVFAKFADATNEVGSTGVDLTLVNFEDGLLKMRQNNAPTVVPPNFNLPQQWAGFRFVGSEVQVADLARAVRTAGIPWQMPDTTRLSNELGSASAAQARGTLFGCDIFGSNDVATVNTGADSSGCIFCPAAFGLVTKGGPFIERQQNALGRSRYVVGSQVYGVSLIKNVFAVEVITDA